MCFKLLEDTLEIHNGLEAANKTVCVCLLQIQCTYS